MNQEVNEKELQRALNYMQDIPFNKHIGLEIITFNSDEILLRLKMRDELVGNWMHDMLHGGVIASAIDMAGGSAAIVAAYARQGDASEEQKKRNLGKLGTIDMRVDYLRPGKGKEFFISATVLRIGSKVAVTRMELKNEIGSLIAVGTGTYMCG
ncbi:MAG: thioesterase family protein [Bermanella sp.]|jgi:uncharacterized domain 1